MLHSNRYLKLLQRMIFVWKNPGELRNRQQRVWSRPSAGTKNSCTMQYVLNKINGHFYIRAVKHINNVHSPDRGWHWYNDHLYDVVEYGWVKLSIPCSADISYIVDTHHFICEWLWPWISCFGVDSSPHFHPLLNSFEMNGRFDMSKLYFKAYSLLT